MALDSGFYIPGEVSIHDRSRVLRQKRDALGDGAARRRRCMDYRYTQLAALDHDLCTGGHARQQVREVPGGFCLRDVDHIVGRGAIIP